MGLGANSQMNVWIVIVNEPNINLPFIIYIQKVYIRQRVVVVMFCTYLHSKEIGLSLWQKYVHMIFLYINFIFREIKTYRVLHFVNEPPHDKTNRMACAPSKDSDQPEHPPSLIRVLAVCMKKAWVLSYPLSAQRRLIRLGGCPGWSESSLDTQVILLVLSCGDSNVFCVHCVWSFTAIIQEKAWYDDECRSPRK